ncbi:MAG TPA: hypothetical protein VGQ86_01525 [Candidatus Limnocylindria bacterium]|nr:hypothetical protein [Candidatus Limnocylindria bacterium]
MNVRVTDSMPLMVVREVTSCTPQGPLIGTVDADVQAHHCHSTVPEMTDPSFMLMPPMYWTQLRSSHVPRAHSPLQTSRGAGRCGSVPIAISTTAVHTRELPPPLSGRRHSAPSYRALDTMQVVQGECLAARDAH